MDAYRMMDTVGADVSAAAGLQAITERYASRGLVKSVLCEAGEQIRREEQTRESAPEAYRLSLLNDAAIEIRYRRGKENMAAGDLVRYFEETHERRIAATDLSYDGGMDRCPAEEGRSLAPIPAERGGVAAVALERARRMPREVCGRLTSALPTWFDTAEPDTSDNRRSFPLSAFAALLAVAVSLMLIVASSVMLMRAESRVNSLRREVNAQSAELAKLRSDLDVKNDLIEIRRIATEEYGMVSEEYVRTTYLLRDVRDSVEVYEEEREDSVGLAAILSAIGITK